MLTVTKNLKFITINSILALIMVFSGLNMLSAQEIIEDKPKEIAKDTIDNTKRRKIDGVAAVVGEYVLLDSDIDKEYAQIKAAGGQVKDFSRCELFGKLLEDKLYAHHAIQDSILVNELEIRGRVEQQIDGFLAQSGGTLDELLKFYNKSTEDELREEMVELNKNMQLVTEMQNKIVEEIEVTPEEVRQFFNDLDEKPIFGTELQVAQIVVIPEVTQEEIDKVIDQLSQFKKDVEEDGASFTSKVVLYTDDIASKRTGGKYTLNRKRPQMVKEFRDVAFSLQEGEISEPFKTEFGYHIIYKEKERGQEIDVRHILLRPKVTPSAIQAAREKLQAARDKIVSGELTFAEAALKYSDEVETKFEGGRLINPMTQDFNFELTRMDTQMYTEIQDLKDDEVSPILQDEDRVNAIKFKILKVTNRTDEHEADFSRDYLKIKRLALQEKQLETVSKWQDQKIKDTYIKINGEHRKCQFSGNWLKN
ncbi:peptidylprolyl isomerase [Paucihalobacter ruber]|uniref:Peptidylprolyl isomerase n=1 Tax=Paucihalobacter ruber TaxID=2567861 RepID=A0A506PJ71_9FLAO|nr:peptidylprolyl isomerase [Paucihalobacter ruber]